MDLCILIPAIVGLICAILGYLLGRLFGSNNSNTDDIDDCMKRNAKLETDLKACQSKLSMASSISNTTASPPPSPNIGSSFAASENSAIVFDGDAAKAVFGKKIKQDDLKLVEGIGPKIEQLFHNHGVTTWKALSECSVDKCQNVLNSGGDRYKMHKPGTWPRQAKLASEGKWQELLDWQDKLDGGK